MEGDNAGESSWSLMKADDNPVRADGNAERLVRNRCTFPSLVCCCVRLSVYIL